MQNNAKPRAKTEQKLAEPHFIVELTIGADSSFCDALLEAIDEAFTSMGEMAKVSIYSHLEHSMGIKKCEIPFRIDDFQNALERIFGLGARHLEILFVKNLHEKLKIRYRWTMPTGILPDLTFQEYIRLTKKAFEDSNAQDSQKKLQATDS